jgi:hypothetical protein
VLTGSDTVTETHLVRRPRRSCRLRTSSGPDGLYLARLKPIDHAGWTPQTDLAGLPRERDHHYGSQVCTPLIVILTPPLLKGHCWKLGLVPIFSR